MNSENKIYYQAVKSNPVLWWDERTGFWPFCVRSEQESVRHETDRILFMADTNRTDSCLFVKQNRQDSAYLLSDMERAVSKTDRTGKMVRIQSVHAA